MEDWGTGHGAELEEKSVILERSAEIIGLTTAREHPDISDHATRFVKVDGGFADLDANFFALAHVLAINFSQLNFVEDRTTCHPHANNRHQETSCHAIHGETRSVYFNAVCYHLS